MPMQEELLQMACYHLKHSFTCLHNRCHNYVPQFLEEQILQSTRKVVRLFCDTRHLDRCTFNSLTSCRRTWNCFWLPQKPLSCYHLRNSVPSSMDRVPILRNPNLKVCCECWGEPRWFENFLRCLND